MTDLSFHSKTRLATLIKKLRAIISVAALRKIAVEIQSCGIRLVTRRHGGRTSEHELPRPAAWPPKGGAIISPDRYDFKKVDFDFLNSGQRIYLGRGEWIESIQFGTTDKRAEQSASPKCVNAACGSGECAPTSSQGCGEFGSLGSCPDRHGLTRLQPNRQGCVPEEVANDGLPVQFARHSAMQPARACKANSGDVHLHKTNVRDTYTYSPIGSADCPICVVSGDKSSLPVGLGNLLRCPYSRDYELDPVALHCTPQIDNAKNRSEKGYTECYLLHPNRRLHCIACFFPWLSSVAQIRCVRVRPIKGNNE